MSKHLEKSADQPSSSRVELPVVLSSRYRWLRWRGVLIAGILGLTATLLALWLVPGSWHATQHMPWIAEIWGGGLLVTLGVVFVAYWSASESLLSTAQKLDGQFAAKGRLEAVALLKDSTSPLAKAQREETMLYLARETAARPVRGLAWLASCLVMLMLAHLLTLILWFKPSLVPASVAKPLAAMLPPVTQPATTPPPATNDNSKPVISWKTPETAIEANPLEQVPAEATVQSPTALQNLRLEVSVNGELKKSMPIPAEQYSQPGSNNEIEVTVPLDELKVKPFDVVSYKLTAQNSTSEKTADITSPTQFIQVRPFRNQVTQTGSSVTTTQSNASDLLDDLQQAQLRALSNNMNLAHDTSSLTDSERQKEDARVAADQTALAAKTQEVANALNDQHAPNQAIDQLHQAEPLMDDSGKKILAAQNDAAQVSQQKAVSLIANAETALQPATDAAAPPAPPTGSNPNDPFNDQQKHELSPRQQSLIEQLETLAKNQTTLAQDIGDKHSDDSTGRPQIDPTTLTPAPPAPANPATAINPNQANPITTNPVSAQSAANASTPPASANPTQTNPAPAQAAASASSPPASTNPTQPAANPVAPPAPATAAPSTASATTPPPAPPPIDPFGPDANKGNFAERQDRVLQGITTLQSADKADLDTTNQPLTAAQQEATDSLHQLGAEQENAAREPAATAALDLQQTVQTMNEAGEAETRQTLAETQQTLNGLASELRGLAQNHPADASQQLMATATQVHGVQQSLQSAADHQQNAGSAAGATQLNQLAQSIQDQKSAAELAAMSKSGLDLGRVSAQADNLENLARQVAAGLTPAQPTAQDFAGLADALQRTDANLAHLADKAGQASSSSGSGKPADQGQPTPPADAASLSQAYHEAFQNLKNQTQQMAKLVPGTDASAVQDVIIRYDKDTSYRAVTPKDVVRFHADLQAPLEKAIVDVQGLQQHAQRDEVVAAPDLDETPAAYRPAVSDYFQSISRDYHSSPPPDNSKP